MVDVGEGRGVPGAEGVRMGMLVLEVRLNFLRSLVYRKLVLIWIFHKPSQCHHPGLRDLGERVQGVAGVRVPLLLGAVIRRAVPRRVAEHGGRDGGTRVAPSRDAGQVVTV